MLYILVEFLENIFKQLSITSIASELGIGSVWFVYGTTVSEFGNWCSSAGLTLFTCSPWAIWQNKYNLCDK